MSPQLAPRLAAGAAAVPSVGPAAPKQQATTDVGVLLASGCGTAVAAVCAAGIVSITGSAPGLWALLAVLTAGGLAWLLAGCFARLAQAVPSRAGLLAYLGRGLGRRAALLLTLPYLLASLFLVGSEASVVGQLLARTLGGPVPAYAVGFLFFTWLLCRQGVRLSLRLQALCTWLLLFALSGVALYVVADAAQRGLLVARLARPTPSLVAFITAVVQALFLFMGFELITSQGEPVSAPTLRTALRGSVLLLTLFYGLLSVALVASGLPDPHGATGPTLSTAAVPQLVLAEQAAGRAAVWTIAGLSLLASYTSFNGALLAFSRLAAALAALGYLPRRIAQLDSHSLLPRQALTALLLVGLLSTALVLRFDLLLPTILATAPLAALVYAGIAWAQQAPAFAALSHPRGRRALGRTLAILLATIALLSISALPTQPRLAHKVLGLIAAAYAASLFALAAPTLRRIRGSR